MTIVTSETRVRGIRSAAKMSGGGRSTLAKGCGGRRDPKAVGWTVGLGSVKTVPGVMDESVSNSEGGPGRPQNVGGAVSGQFWFHLMDQASVVPRVVGFFFFGNCFERQGLERVKTVCDGR